MKPKPLEGELMKVGRRTERLAKRWFTLNESGLVQFKTKASLTPKDVIFLNGLYIEPLAYKGMKGFRIFHDSEYFREKKYFHPDNSVAEKWIRAILEHAAYFDVKTKYQIGRLLGKGKFSNVYMATALEVQSSEDDAPLAMKILDKKALTPKEREFLRDEIQIIHTI